MNDEQRHLEYQAAKRWLEKQEDTDMDAFDAMIRYRKETGERIDWHVFSYAMSALEQAGQIKHVGYTPSMMCCYHFGRAK